MQDVFLYILPNKNDNLSQMNGIDLQYLLILINEYYIGLRDKLNIPSSITFGLELEFEDAKVAKIKHVLREMLNNSNWLIKSDLSLKCGAEINSPILNDNNNSWQELKEVCDIVKNLAEIQENCGGHIHIGTQILGDNKETWLNFIKMWSVYENIIFRFLYGEFLNARSNISQFAKPMAKNFIRHYRALYNCSLDRIINGLNHEKYQAVNLKNVDLDFLAEEKSYNTIEFRSPNGTLNPIIWQNNVNFLVKFLLYCKSSFFNDDIVEKRRNIKTIENIKLYDEIYLEQALELCDMVFTNNLDKVYFLRQYLKSFDTCKKSGKLAKAKVFTKK